MGSNSNIVILEKNNNEWVEKLSDIPQKWFMIVSKKPDFFLNKTNFNILKKQNCIIYYCREKEKELQIKSKDLLQLFISFYTIS